MPPFFFLIFRIPLPFTALHTEAIATGGIAAVRRFLLVFPRRRKGKEWRAIVFPLPRTMPLRISPPTDVPTRLLFPIVKTIHRRTIVPRPGVKEWRTPMKKIAPHQLVLFPPPISVDRYFHAKFAMTWVIWMSSRQIFRPLVSSFRSKSSF